MAIDAVSDAYHVNEKDFGLNGRMIVSRQQIGQWVGSHQ